MRAPRITTALLLALVLATSAAPVLAQSGDPATGGTVTLTPPVAVTVPGIPGQPPLTAAVATTARVVADGPVPTGTRLPTAIAPAGGLGADGADLGDAMAWLSPPEALAFQFAPSTTRLEHLYTTVELLPESRAVPLQAGDHVDIAVADVVGNTPLPWDQPRGAADGELRMDVGVDRSRLTASYGGLTGTADALIGRVDVLAVGGDVDARGTTRRVSATIDLGRTYPPGTPISAAASVFSPSTAYIANLDIIGSAEAGEIVVAADVEGYLPEASQEPTRDGVAAAWRIPLLVAITVGDQGSPVAGLRLPADGFAAVSQGGTSRMVHVPAGDTLLVGADAPAVLRDPLGDLRVAPERTARVGRAGGTTPPPVPPPSDDRPTVLADEWVDATAVHAGMTAPVAVRAALGRFGLVVDPDHLGQGTLAVRDVTALTTGQRLAEVWTVPSAIVDGERVVLDRSRLRDLRLRTGLDDVVIGFTGLSDPSPDLRRVRSQFGNIATPALHLTAVYDIGAGRRLLVEVVAVHPDEDLVPQVVSFVYELPLGRGPAADIGPLLVLAQPAADLTYGGVPVDRELDRLLDDGRQLVSRGVRIGVSSRTSSPTVLRAVRLPGDVTELPAAHPRPLGDRPVGAFYQVAPSLRSPSATLTGTAQVLPAASPGPLGVRCRPAEVVDDTLDAPPPTDVVEAWFDSDGAAIRASIRVRDLPAAAPAGSTLTYRVAWRHEHLERWLEGRLDATGAWRFVSGPFPLRDVTGEVRTGPDGVVRISVPRTIERLLDGELLRDTSALATLRTPAGTTSDRARGGAGGHGTGADHPVGAACP